MSAITWHVEARSAPRGGHVIYAGEVDVTTGDRGTSQQMFDRLQRARAAVRSLAAPAKFKQWPARSGISLCNTCKSGQLRSQVSWRLASCRVAARPFSTIMP